MIVARATDKTPIYFLVEREEVWQTNNANRPGFGVHNKPIYYKSDGVYCRTVGDALRTILFNENTRTKPRWRTDFYGNWDRWWKK